MLSGLQKGIPADQVWLTETINIATTAPDDKKVDLSAFKGVIVIVDGTTSTTGGAATILSQVMAISSLLPIIGTGAPGDITATGEFVDAVTQSVINILDPTGKASAPTGEIINSPTLQKLGFLPPDRIFTFPQSVSTSGTSTTTTSMTSSPKSTSFTLTALDQPSTTTTMGYLMARIRVQDGSSYTIEYRPFQLFRPKTEFSPPRTVLMNKSTPVIKSEDGWKECGRCQCLVNTANNHCTDGQMHSFDISEKGYGVYEGKDGNWNRCGGCGDLFSGTTGVCILGGNHVAVEGEKYNVSIAPPPSPSPPPHSASPLAAVSITPFYSIDGKKDIVQDGNHSSQQNPPKPQETWRQCTQCNCFIYFGTSPNPSYIGPCANNKPHILGPDKFILTDPYQPPLWRKCFKCSCLCWIGNLVCLTGGCHVFGTRDYLLSYKMEEKFDVVGFAGTVAAGGTFSDGTGVVIKVGEASADGLSVGITVSVS